MSEPVLLALGAQESTSVRAAKRKLNSLIKMMFGVAAEGSAALLDKGQLPEFKVHVDDALECWAKFKKIWENLEDAFVKAKSDEFPSEQDILIYESVAAEIQSAKISNLKLQSREKPDPKPDFNTSSFSQSSSRHLPRISLPSFNGELTSWKPFHDTFTALVHDDPSLSNIEKFNYLKNSLKSEAATLISKLTVTSDNYQQAWEIVQKTYDNPRVLASHYIKKVLDRSPDTGRPSLDSYQSYLSNVIDNVESFKNLKLEDSSDFLLSLMSLRALDPTTRREFELSHLSTDFPSTDNVYEFIRNRIKAIRLAGDSESPGSSKSVAAPSDSRSFPHRGSRRYQGVSFHTSYTPESSNGPRQRGALKSSRWRSHQSSSRDRKEPSALKPCCFCQGKHGLYSCLKFTELSHPKKLAFVKAWKGCINCLREGHKVSECSSSYSCRFCRGRHHSLLHGLASDDQPNPESHKSSGATFHAREDSCQQKGRQVLLGTAQIVIKSSNGRVAVARAMLDSCSQFSFIVSSLAKKLACPTNKFDGRISGLGGTDLNKPVGSASCIIIGNGIDFPVNAVIVDNIASQVPSSPIPSELVDGIMSRDLADDNFDRPSPVEVLIGGDLYPRLLTGAPIASGVHDIYLLPTVFGLVALGSAAALDSEDGKALVTLEASAGLEEIMKKFWEVEEPKFQTEESPGDAYCRRLFKETTTRTPSGRFVVQLPVIPESEPCGDNREVAKRRFFNLEEKMKKNVELRDHYSRFMKEYLDLGHMSLTQSPSNYIIPHHGIWQNSPRGKKLRVVFDASCPAPPGYLGGPCRSLNDIMFSGPKVQSDISDILSRFRLYAVALTTDLVKMYRQILVHPEQRKLQHIYWREDPTLPLLEMELNTLTYGEGPCAYLAISVVLALAEQEASRYPLAASRIANSMYVDDFVSGGDTLDEAERLKDELVNLFHCGGFTLDKWASNVPSLIPNGQKSDRLHDIMSPDDQTLKILGLAWNSEEDVFTYSIMQAQEEATKRSLLSWIARIFDPLGFLAPVVFQAKCLIQELWKAKLDWDDPLPAELLKRWHCLLDEWDILGNITIPRYITWPVCERFLIGFCDASEKGYGATCYLLSRRPDDVSQAHLLKSKTKVAPTKFSTIARLELCGALLLARLVSSIDISIYNIKETFCFTDSMVVLAWLNSPTYKLKTYEANRVSAILSAIPATSWKHVRSGDNPADLCSRGCTPVQLQQSVTWWEGPPWMREQRDRWPVSGLNGSHDRVDEVMYAFITVEPPKKPDDPILSLVDRVSSLNSLVRTVSLVLRFARRNISGCRSGTVNAADYQQALRKCVIATQRKFLPQNLCNPQKLSSPFIELSPFLDKEGVFRVGGRLKKAPVAYSQRHPVLLPREAPLARLIVLDVHNRNFHSGPSLTLALTRTSFWISGGLRFVKGLIRQCVTCRVQKVKGLKPFMGDLPAERFAQFKAFVNTGVDFAGPFFIRPSKRRSSPRGRGASLDKAYLCIFICLSSRAVHLECVTSLSTIDFFSALDRFISRRGTPRTIYSDNGSNFIGASNFLKDLFRFLRKHETELTDHLAPRNIEWRFTPPLSPHFGGSWEAGVKSVKALLTHTVGNQPFTYEEISTMFTKIEGLLNSRPLCPLSEEPDTFDFLTPGHFLAGAALTFIPEFPEDQDKNPRSRWDLVKKQVEQVWSRWRTEYLHHLQQRSKWLRPEQNLRVGELVILIGKQHIPGHWPVARIVDTHPGSDSIVRVVTVVTPSGSTMKRSVASLAPLFAPDRRDP